MQIAPKKRRHAAAAFCQRSLLERYIVSYGAFASGTIRQALQHGADLPLGGLDLGMERTGGDAQRRSRRSS